MQSKMQDTHRDKLAKMAKGDDQAFRDLFSWASPKFVCSVGSREFYEMQVDNACGFWSWFWFWFWVWFADFEGLV